jgi:hypothetical protein
MVLALHNLLKNGYPFAGCLDNRGDIKRKFIKGDATSIPSLLQYCRKSQEGSDDGGYDPIISITVNVE